jgi:hypothetical protein
MPDKEMVLQLGVEGGGATIFRTPLASGGWQFHVEGSSIYLDENDDEDWRRWSSEPVLSIGEAMQSVAEDGSWVMYYPMTIHPEYRIAVWELAQATASKLPDESSGMWKRRRADWQRQCQPESYELAANEDDERG